MDILLIAKVLGIIFTVMGVSMLISKKNAMYLIEDATSSRGLLWLFGFIALVMGAVIIVLNNDWSSGLRSLVSLIGWLALIKGAFILILPDVAISWYRKCNKGGIMTFAGLVVLVLGLVFLYKGVM